MKIWSKEKLILYIWLSSLCAIILIGVIFCLKRPPTNIVSANNDLINMSEKIRSHYRHKPDYWGLNLNEAIKNNLYVGVIEDDKIVNTLKKPVIIGADSEGNQVMPGQHDFMISYTDLNQKECLEFASFNWKEKDRLGLISMSILNTKGIQVFSWGEDGLPLSRSRAKQYCEDQNIIMWSFE